MVVEGVLVVVEVILGERGGGHVDLGAQREACRSALGVEFEHDSLTLPEHAEHRAVERVGGEIELGEVGVGEDDTVARPRVV